MNSINLPSLSANGAVTRRRRIKWDFVAGVVGCHLLALLALLPQMFSWSGVVVWLVGHYVFGTLGVCVGFHRLLTHRGFQCPKWLERTLVLLGVCTLQEAPAFWVAVHRRHHQFADHEPDPHTPLVGFLWAHMGWIFVEEPGEERTSVCERYAADVLRDPFYAGLNSQGWHLLAFASWALFFAGGWTVATLAGSSPAEAVRFGGSILIWGACVRTVMVWHVTWSVNSVTHLWGYRNYPTKDDSRNNVLIGFIASGEGWHNNHHADPRSARHGHRWWELDLSFLTIRLLGVLGLAHHIVMPSRQLAPSPPAGIAAK
jgi:fatty-acid desaturase